MEKLIERMKEEGLNVSVFNYWYTEFLKNAKICSDTHNAGGVYVGTTAEHNMHLFYENINGYLWGLDVLGYIDEDLHIKYTDELIKTTIFDSL